MGFIFLIILVGGICAIAYFSSTFSSRIRGTILKDTPFSESSQVGFIDSAVEVGYKNKFLQEHPEYTEESIKNLVYQYVVQLFNKNPLNEFAPSIHKKMQKDSKLDKLKNMQYVRSSFAFYGNSRLSMKLIFSDTRDEYIVQVGCLLKPGAIEFHNYYISRGAVLGF